MSGARVADVVFYGLFLLLPLSALFARRLPIARTATMALAWLAIFGMALLLVSQRSRFEGLTTLFSDQRTTGSETRIQMAHDGHFWADVTIDGVSRRMLIDSGATTTALSVATARAAGLDTGKSPFPVLLETANGTISAQSATARHVVVGSIAIDDLGVVVSPAAGDLDLLGMNFLSRLTSWRVEKGTLILTP
ncbi:MAG: TIGR02281 family clan AA aspartic protease [Pseudomonadota bacterium]|nr:TIGR02281 family clan AA aspartic protease [Pseudomonadota bacterium]